MLLKHLQNTKLILIQNLHLLGTKYLLDAVGSWQKILPMPNLERAYYSDKESEAVLQNFQN